MEDSSQELIDQMIAEEKYCYGFDTVPHITSIGGFPDTQQQQLQFPLVNTTQEKSLVTNGPVENSFDTVDKSISESINTEPTLLMENTKEAKPKKEHASTGSSSLLPSHNQRWSEQEDTLLSDGVELFGYGHWKAVSEHVKTRNSLQCKNRARQKFATGSQQKSKPKKNDNSYDKFVNSSIPNSSSSESASEAYKTPTTPPLPSTYYETIFNNGADGLGKSSVDYGNSSIALLDSQRMLPTLPMAHLTSQQTEHFTKINNSTAEKDVYKVENYDNQQNELGEPQKVGFELNQSEISEDERLQNAEWFMGKPAKTPERYMRIRNHIICCWKKNNPNYLTKTAGRKNLADCGDVNAVGRIHAYLESVNAININCTSPVQRNYAGRSPANRSEDGLPKKKKVRKTPSYFWANIGTDEEEFEKKDYIIQGDGKSRPRRAVKKRETFYNEIGNESGQYNDPFTLVPVGYYPNERSAPFTVDITSDALLIIDFHSHLAYTEIIGLLGGRLVHTEDGSQQLKVEYVFPCRSTSTGIQCEMDPVSEMTAREVFEQKGLHVVGWYHSHPTFEPEPSIRDIENQTSYQDLFRDSISGIEPFIGVIITPYNSRNIVPDKSQFQFIHISRRWSANKSYRLPFACLQKVTQCKTISREVFEILQGLITEYKTYEHKINMTLPYGPVTRLDKLMRSLKNHLFMEPENNEKFLSDLRYIIQRDYEDQAEGQEVDTNAEDGIQHTMLTQESRQKQTDNIVNSLAI